MNHPNTAYLCGVHDAQRVFEKTARGNLLARAGEVASRAGKAVSEASPAMQGQALLSAGGAAAGGAAGLASGHRTGRLLRHSA